MNGDRTDVENAATEANEPGVINPEGSLRLQRIKTNIHRKLMDRLNLKLLESLDHASAKQEISSFVRELLAEESTPLNATEKTLIIDEVCYEVLGFGPIEPLLADSTVSDILINTYADVYVERRGVLEHTAVKFQNNEHLMRIIEKIASSVGRRIDESSPMVDARLPDGSRVNAIIPPLAVDGPVLSIRKFSVDPYTIHDLINFKSLTPAMGDFLAGAVKAKTNIIVTGGTGSGKTTLLNVLSSFIPKNERIITIEDSAELQLQQPHVVRLETRPPNIEGKGEVVQRDLVRNALRMRPDRIVVGEVRGGEALDMLQAMNTGHDGSISTIHANSPRDALTRIEHMVGMTGVPIPALVVRQQMAAALNLLIDIDRLPDGRRAVTSIQEITGMEENVVNMQEIFMFERKSVDAKGKVIGEFHATGIRPNMLKRFKEYGVKIDENIFDPNRIYE
jgi:pilus assembly protein CpaF